MRFVRVLLKVFLLVCNSRSQNANRYTNSDVGLTQKQLIVKYGYPLETHKVKTEDGYILQMFRIPSGRNNTSTGQSLPVLFIPPLLTSSSVWLLMGPESALPYLLADRGYDVWLGNVRGTTWSKKHVKLKSKYNQQEFWDFRSGIINMRFSFNFHEIGCYDLPAFIDYILSISKHDDLYYFGHSQGATSFLSMVSMKPEYNNKIRLMCALSPAIYMDNSGSSIVNMLATYNKEIQTISDTYKLYEILPHNPLITVLGHLFCNDRSPFHEICAALIYFIVGYSDHFTHSLLPVITSTSPAGASIKQLLHYGQLHSAKQFQQFDYGAEENMIKYGQSKPLLYNLSKVTVPVALYYGDNDRLSAVIDVERTSSELHNIVKKKVLSGFNHIDVILAKDVVPLLYNDIIQLMKGYEFL